MEIYHGECCIGSLNNKGGYRGLVEVTCTGSGCGTFVGTVVS